MELWAQFLRIKLIFETDGNETVDSEISFSINCLVNRVVRDVI